MFNATSCEYIELSIQSSDSNDSSDRDDESVLCCIEPSCDYLNPKELKVRVCLMK